MSRGLGTWDLGLEVQRINKYWFRFGFRFKRCNTSRCFNTLLSNSWLQKVDPVRKGVVNMLTAKDYPFGNWLRTVKATTPILRRSTTSFSMAAPPFWVRRHAPSELAPYKDLRSWGKHPFEVVQSGWPKGAAVMVPKRAKKNQSPSCCNGYVGPHTSHLG